jgi:hypothetical protein
MWLVRSLGTSALIGAAFGVSACTGEAQAGPVATTPTAGYVPGPSDPNSDSVYSTYLAYQTAPPVDDIETYPSVLYDGVTVYYVGGGWYRHDEHGWGVYRQEPPELAKQREAHAREPRWVQATTRDGRVRNPPPVDHEATAAPAGLRREDVAPARAERSSPPVQAEPRMEAPKVVAPRPVRVAQPPRNNNPGH